MTARRTANGSGMQVGYTIQSALSKIRIYVRPRSRVVSLRAWDGPKDKVKLGAANRESVDMCFHSKYVLSFEKYVFWDSS